VEKNHMSRDSFGEYGIRCRRYIGHGTVYNIIKKYANLGILIVAQNRHVTCDNIKYL